jgi:hypothetical protein
MSFYGTAFAEDLGGYATTCEEIGFKPRSEAFGNCVLELRRRNQKNLDAPLPDITSRKPERRAQRDTGIQHPTAGDGTPDDLTCQKFGISPGTDAYGQCRVQLKTAAETAQRQHAVYEQQRRDSEQQIAAQEEARRKRERDQASNNLIEYGLRLMGGQAPIDAALGVQGKPPITRQIAPQDPVMQNFQINTPGGFANCTYNSALRIMNCF